LLYFSSRTRASSMSCGNSGSYMKAQSAVWPIVIGFPKCEDSIAEGAGPYLNSRIMGFFRNPRTARNYLSSVTMTAIQRVGLLSARYWRSQVLPVNCHVARVRLCRRTRVFSRRLFPDPASVCTQRELRLRIPGAAAAVAARTGLFVWVAKHGDGDIGEATDEAVGCVRMKITTVSTKIIVGSNSSYLSTRSPSPDPRLQCRRLGDAHQRIRVPRLLRWLFCNNR
jgi:hypothetical protein